MESGFDSNVKLWEVLRLRIFLNRIIDWFSRSLFAGSIFSLFLSICALGLPFKFDRISILMVILYSVAIVLPVAMINLPDNNEIIARIDSFELKETLVPIKVNSKLLAIIIAIFSLACALTFIETDARLKTFEMDKFKSEAAKGVNELERIKNEINLSSNLTDIEKKTLGEKIDSINEELSKVRNAKDMSKALVKVQDELVNILQVYQKDIDLKNNSIRETRRQIIDKIIKSITDIKNRIEGIKYLQLGINNEIMKRIGVRNLYLTNA